MDLSFKLLNHLPIIVQIASTTLRKRQIRRRIISVTIRKIVKLMLSNRLTSESHTLHIDWRDSKTILDFRFHRSEGTSNNLKHDKNAVNLSTARFRNMKKY